MTGPPIVNNRIIPRVNAAAGGGGEPAPLLAVADTTELVALDDTAIDDGGVVSMRSVLDLWMLDKSSTLVPDGITVVAAPTAGNWVRLNLSNLTWQLQADWYIDEAAGDDENDGNTAGTALATWAEYSRRIGEGPLTVSHTVNLVGTVTQDIEVRTSTQGDDISLTIAGARSAPLYSSTFSGVTNENAAANQELQLVDAALPVSWTASGLTEKLYVLTSGANAGAAGWIVKDLGARTARATWAYSDATGFVEPAVGDDFEIVDLGLVQGILRGGRGNQLTVYVSNLRFEAATRTVFESYSSQWNIVHCDLEGRNMILSARPQLSAYSGATLVRATRLWSQRGMQVNRATVAIGGVFAASYFALRAGGTLLVGDTSICQYTGAGSIGMAISGASRVTNRAPVGFFDWPDLDDRAVQLGTSSQFKCEHYLYGYGNTFNHAIEVQSDATLEYDPAYKPLIAGSVASDTLIGNLGRNYASLPAIVLNRKAGILLSTV